MLVVAVPLVLVWTGRLEIGFEEYTPPTPETERAKTLWDLGELCLVPLALGLGATAFAFLQNKRERELEQDRLRETALQRYLDRRAPWFQIKEAKAAAATTVYVILRVVDNRKTILAPILPQTAQKLHEYLGHDGQLFGTQHVFEYQEETRSHLALTYDHSSAIGTWAPSELPPGQALRQPAPLFAKLDESVIEEEYARLGE
jgi:methionyl-tRNA synthetase